jgi:hypothetical protein
LRGGRAVKSALSSKDGAVVIIMMAAIAANFFILISPFNVVSQSIKQGNP